MVSKKHIISEIKEQGILVKRSLQNDELIIAIQHCAKALKNLRSSHIPLSIYFEFYNLIDEKCLSVLSDYLTESHKNDKFDLNEVYEIVQYTGNVLPRLYLLIVVGDCFLKINGDYRVEILKDIMEMTRGEQDPIKGLFLRYYISIKIFPVFFTEEFKEVDLSFKCNFVLTNFIECNRLWVRLQYQGFLQERIQHIKDREEIRQITGSQLLHLSKIIGDNTEVYKSDILPVLHQQLIKCNDVMAQTYLFEVILDVFPVSFHLGTLESMLNVTLNMHHDLSINELIMKLIEKLDKATENLNVQLTEYTKVFWDYLTELNEKNPSLPLLDFIPLLSNIMDLSLNEMKADNINGYFELLNKKLEANKTEITKEEGELLYKFLTFSDLRRIQCYSSFALKFLTSSSKTYSNVLQIQPYSLKCAIIVNILTKVLNSNKPLIISSDLELEALLVNVAPIMENGDIKGIDQLQDLLAKLLNFIFHTYTVVNVQDSLELALKLKNWVYHANINFIGYAYPVIVNKLWELVGISESVKAKYGSRTKIVKQYDTQTKQLFRHISRCLNDMLIMENELNSELLTLVYKLTLSTATLSDKFLLTDITADFISQAFEILEDKIMNTAAEQLDLVNYMIQTLHKSKSLNNEENLYERFSIRCIVNASRLLKKQTQSRAIYNCSHLWWGKTYSLTNCEGSNTSNDFLKDGKRILECLQKSLRLADSVMDNIISCQIMIEILELCLFYYNDGDDWDTQIGPNYINQLISLIKNTTKTLEMEMNTASFTNLKMNDGNAKPSEISWVMSTSFTYIPVNKIIDNKLLKTDSQDITVSNKILIPLNHFERISKYIESQKSVNSKYDLINI